MIKIDMKMPSCCIECPFYSGYDSGRCLASYDELRLWNNDVIIDRNSHCPLQEVDDNDI